MKKNLPLLLIVFLLASLHFIFIKINQWQLPKPEFQKPVLIQGEITSVPIKKFHGLQFKFHVNYFQHKKINTVMLISWYSYPKKLQIGQHWQLNVTLKPPIGSHNPGGFDYQQFLLSKGIAATGYVNAKSRYNKLLGNNKLYALSVFREKIHGEIKKSIQDKTLAAFISALCVGLRDGLTESDWQVFQKTGTNHLVAIAGLHIGFVAALFYFMINKLWRLSSRLLLFVPATRAAEIAALAGALLYSALSGFAVPAQRASIMLFFLMMGNIFCRRISIGRRLFFAASIIIILNPFNLMDASFCLSFMSIGFLTWIMAGRLQSEKHIKSWVKMQGAILIGLLPIMLLFFQQASIIAFFTNAVAIPWIGFVILPVSLFSVLLYFFNLHLLSQKLFFLSGKLLLPLWKFLTWSSYLSFASWHHAINKPFVLIAGIIGALYLLVPQKLPAKWIGCFGLLPLFFYQPPVPKVGNYWVTVIDVGQGLSVLVQTAHHVMLYDTGAHFPGGFDFGESVVAPYLRYRGIRTIDRLEISHGDNDHSGGADAIVKDFTVKTIFTSAPKLIAHFNADYCAAGQSWVWDNVYFSTLSPAPNASYADNNSSCVIQISSRGGKMLLTGDIEKLTEYELVYQYGAQLQSAVLLSPHHGSRTSSSNAFLKAILPRYAIISAGELNRYHLPSAAVLLRYQQNHIKVYNTAVFGAIIIKVGGRVSVIADQ
ncbi:MAG: DNA internalization-related competence protein ComEC/Rec2 [Gammaproteobacteria bacterium]|nr:DNA internalization-related competence protein ComEC/Rec2 [Gammaproteobacteria bacterium]